MGRVDLLQVDLNPSLMHLPQAKGEGNLQARKSRARATQQARNVIYRFRPA